jgi:SurA-like N-terminal domain
MQITEWRVREKRQGALLAALKTVKDRVRRSICSIMLLVWTVTLVLALASAGYAELLDRVVASVNNDVITLSELNRAVAFNAALGGVADDKLRAETLEGLVNRHLLLQDAYRLKFVEVSDQDRQAELEKLQKRLGSEKAFSDFLARLDMTREELGRMLGRRLLVERFVEKKIGLYVRVSREEAQAYFDAHPVEFKGKGFTEMQKPISALLSEQKLEQQTAQYLADLKSRADIRMNP